VGETILLLCLVSWVRLSIQVAQGDAAMWLQQIPPFLRQRHNVSIELLCKSSFGPRKNLSLRPWFSAHSRFPTFFELVPLS